MTACKHSPSGCNYPEGECAGLCMKYPVIDRLRWHSKAVHAGRHMQQAEQLRQSPRFAELLRRVRAETSQGGAAC